MIATILDNADPATQQRLLVTLEPLGRQIGCGEVFDEWEERFDWMKSWRPGEPAM